MTDSGTIGMVELLGGFHVPQRFTIRLRGRARRAPVSVEADVEMIGGKPHLRALALGAPGARPLSAADLSGISLTEVLDAAVQQAALQHTPMRWEPGDDAPVPAGSFISWVRDQSAADESAARTAARAARDRGRITPDLLRRVLDLYASGGIGAVMDQLHYSERNARRLLARARKELP